MEISMPLDDDILAACQPLLDDLATQWLASLAEFVTDTAEVYWLLDEIAFN
jgi:hypothetical protein